MKYARTAKDKQDKRNLMLGEVRRQFRTKGFDEIKMADVAKHCGVSKGTVFNYFDSKETLFLVLLIHDYDRWFEEFYRLLERQSALNEADLQKVVLNYIEKTITTNETLFKLIGLGHSCLEHNVSLRMAEKYRKFINEKCVLLGQMFDQKSCAVTLVQGIKLAMTLHTIFIGHVQIAHLPEIMQKNLTLEELQAYDVNFQVTVLETLKVYMHGLLAMQKR